MRRTFDMFLAKCGKTRGVRIGPEQAGSRRRREFFRSLLGCLPFVAVFSACAGGGGNTVPAAVNPTVPLPGTATGIIAAAGPLTILSGGSIIGSTVSPSSGTAILTVDSGTTPKEISVGGTLLGYSLDVSDTAGQNFASVARTSRTLAGFAHRPQRDADVRIPDTIDPHRTRQLMLELQRRSSTALRVTSGPGATSPVRHVRSFAPGEQKTFELQGGTIDGAVANPTPIPMPATLVAQSAHANVWLDTAVYTNAAALQREYPSGTSDFTAVARTFETVFSIETRAFGPAYTTGIVNFQQCDASGTPLADPPPAPDTTGAVDPRINVVITDQLKGSGEGGYFYGLDLLDQAEANCVAGPNKPTVNGLPMLVIESDNYPPYSGSATETYPANNEAYWLNGDMPQTLAHEFQHYLHFVNKYLEQHVENPNNPDAGTLDDSYIDEGCSVLAQDLVAANAVDNRESPAFVRAFLLEPGDFSLTSFTGYQPDALNSTSSNPPYGYYHNTAGNYGYAYLFVRYLYDRFGPGALKAIYSETNFGGARNPDTGPATAAAGGEPFPGLFRDFTTAIAVHSGGSVPEISTDPAYRFDSSVILRGAAQTYSRRLPPYNVRHIVQPGPLNPELFVNNVPSGHASLAAGQTASVSLLDGGAVFITPQQPRTQGTTLSAAGSIDGGGSLGQGPLPTPTPAYY